MAFYYPHFWRKLLKKQHILFAESIDLPTFAVLNFESYGESMSGYG
jgi:hypothetical protein